MTATMTVLRYGPERDGRLAHPEGYNVCLRIRDLYARQRKGIRPFFHFVAATPERVSQETAQMISDADSIKTADCVNNYSMDAYIREKEGGLAEVIADDDMLRKLGRGAGTRLCRFIDDAFNNLKDDQHGLVIVDGFDLAYWAREIAELQPLKIYEPLTGYKGTRSTRQEKVCYRGVSPLEAATPSIEEPVYHSQLPPTDSWVQAKAKGTLAPNNEVITLDGELDDEAITLNRRDQVHKNGE